MESLLERKSILQKRLRDKKGAGLVTGLVMGIVALVIAVIIGFVIVQTLSDASLLSDDADNLANVSTELRANLSAGVQEVSTKIPTILLIAAVVLILGVLVFLWAQYQRMNIGRGSGEI